MGFTRVKYFYSELKTFLSWFCVGLKFFVDLKNVRGLCVARTYVNFICPGQLFLSGLCVGPNFSSQSKTIKHRLFANRNVKFRSKNFVELIELLLFTALLY